MSQSFRLLVPKRPSLYVWLQSHICLWVGSVSASTFGVRVGVLIISPGNLRGRVVDGLLGLGLVDRIVRVLPLLFGRP